MNIQIEDLIPRWLLWTFAIPFMILLIPIGVLYTLMLLYISITSKLRFGSYKHDILFAIVRPGFYVGMFAALFITVGFKMLWIKIIRFVSIFRKKLV